MPAALAVCSWSLQPRDAADLAGKVRACGLDAVQLALDPVRTGAMPVAALRAAFAEHGVGIVSGMMAMAGEDYRTLESIRETGGVVPDATWQENLAAARSNAQLARELAVGLVTFHAGFIPRAGEGARDVLVQRVRALADVFAEEGVRVALETGQEQAEELLELLAELPGTGINFDPGNMILYDIGDPVAALRLLLPRVVQVHIKDAVRTRVPGIWGEEVPVGSGDVDWAAFVAVLKSAGRPIDLVIEREAGAERIADVRRAVQLLREPCA
jgi:sugar phosphate isomerase/epimerase